MMMKRPRPLRRLTEKSLADATSRSTKRVLKHLGAAVLVLVAEALVAAVVEAAAGKDFRTKTTGSPRASPASLAGSFPAAPRQHWSAVKHIVASLSRIQRRLDDNDISKTPKGNEALG